MTKDPSDLVEEALSPDSGRHPWERLKARRKFVEPPRAFEAFAVYRDLGPSRSLTTTQQKLNKNRTTLAQWSGRFRWVARVAEYDDHMDRQSLIEQEEERREMARRHVNLAKLMQQKAYDRLRKIGEKEINQITPKMIPTYLQTAIGIERMAIGEPTERIDHDGSGRIVIVDDIPRKTEEKKRKSTTPG